MHANTLFRQRPWQNTLGVPLTGPPPPGWRSFSRLLSLSSLRPAFGVWTLHSHPRHERLQKVTLGRLRRGWFPSWLVESWFQLRSVTLYIQAPNPMRLVALVCFPCFLLSRFFPRLLQA